MTLESGPDGAPRTAGSPAGAVVASINYLRNVSRHAKPARTSAVSAQPRGSIRAVLERDVVVCRRDDLAQRRVLDHQPPRGPVGEADGDDAVHLDSRDDPCAEYVV